MKAWLAFFGFGWSEWKYVEDRPIVKTNGGGTVAVVEVYQRRNRFTNLNQYKQITRFNCYDF